MCGVQSKPALGHPGDSHRSNEAAMIVQIGLNNIEAAVGDCPAEAGFAEFLLATGDGNSSASATAFVSSK